MQTAKLTADTSDTYAHFQFNFAGLSLAIYGRL